MRTTFFILTRRHGAPERTLMLASAFGTTASSTQCSGCREVASKETACSSPRRVYSNNPPDSLAASSSKAAAPVNSSRGVPRLATRDMSIELMALGTTDPRTAGAVENIDAIRRKRHFSGCDASALAERTRGQLSGCAVARTFRSS